MSTTFIPTNQILHNTPYSQLLLHENTQDSRVYISRRVNQLLKAIGNDLVLLGFDLKQDPVFNGLNVSFTLNPGILIQDSTLIEVKEQIDLSINVAPYDQNTGYLIIYTDYQHLNSSAENPIQFKVSYINSNGTSLTGDIWNSSRNRIIFYRYSFVKTSSLLVSLTLEESDFDIVGKTYSLMGLSNFTNYSFRLYEHASEAPIYGLASETKFGHIRVPQDSNIDIINGEISISEATMTSKGLVQLATDDEAVLMVSKTKVLTPDSIKNIILNLKDIEIQVVDPGITLGTALILS